MSCAYPHCMMGGGSCHDEADCIREDEERAERYEEKRLLDLEEQRLRIAKMKRDLGESPRGTSK